jgi:hypothetical protein
VGYLRSVQELEEFLRYFIFFFLSSQRGQAKINSHDSFKYNNCFEF